MSWPPFPPTAAAQRRLIAREQVLVELLGYLDRARLAGRRFVVHFLIFLADALTLDDSILSVGTDEAGAGRMALEEVHFDFASTNPKRKAASQFFSYSNGGWCSRSLTVALCEFGGAACVGVCATLIKFRQMLLVLGRKKALVALATALRPIRMLWAGPSPFTLSSNLYIYNINLYIYIFIYI